MSFSGIFTATLPYHSKAQKVESIPPKSNTKSVKLESAGSAKANYLAFFVHLPWNLELILQIYNLCTYAMCHRRQLIMPSGVDVLAVKEIQLLS